MVENFSDVVMVTNDNPRHEEPEKIIQEIVNGFKNKNHINVQMDRKKAIVEAIKIAKPEDIILIAGKGHETYQIFKDQILYFDDREEVRKASSILK